MLRKAADKQQLTDDAGSRYRPMPRNFKIDVTQIDFALEQDALGVANRNDVQERSVKNFVDFLLERRPVIQMRFRLRRVLSVGPDQSKYAVECMSLEPLSFERLTLELLLLESLSVDYLPLESLSLDPLALDRLTIDSLTIDLLDTG